MIDRITEQPFRQTRVSTSTFRDWEVYEVLPLGWKIDNSCGSPLHGYDFCTNGKSILNGGKRALVRSIRKGTPRIEFVQPIKQTKIVKKVEPKENFIFPAKGVNNLARLKFKEQLLKEIMFDLMVCEIEGWDKKEYINEIKKLLNSIDTSNKKKVSTSSLPDLFSTVGL
jgi:hypothetical protein